MPKKILILVEGQTEEIFVKTKLEPYFSPKDIFIIPTIISTKKVLSGPDHKGGITSYDQVKRDLLPLLHDSSADTVTTMIDYYALPNNFPGYNNRPSGSCYKTVEFVEDQFGSEIDNRKFHPYLQLHEFESLVYASQDKLHIAFPNNLDKISQIASINNSFTTPEEINDNPETAPSKRLKKIFPEYKKPFHSKLILSQVSVDHLREKCRHFNDWITHLES